MSIQLQLGLSLQIVLTLLAIAGVYHRLLSNAFALGTAFMFGYWISATFLQVGVLYPLMGDIVSGR
jgi:hypothetical protein